MFLRSVICFVLTVSALSLSQSILAGTSVPVNAPAVIPILKKVQQKYWPDHPNPVYLAGQTEQESCVSLKSKLCWSPKAELKTSSEYGFGLYQITITKKFNNFLEAKKLDPALKDWQYPDRYDAEKQTIFFVKTMEINTTKYKGAATKEDQYAFALSGYNGGNGGVQSDITRCKAQKNCDPTKWFGNVERFSGKAKVAKKGYGQSNFCTNRGYPRNVMFSRSTKYLSFFPGSTIKQAPAVPPEVKPCH